MNLYQWLGASSIALMVIALGVSTFILVGRHAKKTVYIVAGSVLTVVVIVSVLCWIIYAQYQ